MDRQFSVLVGVLAAFFLFIAATSISASDVGPGLFFLVLATPFMLWSRNLWRRGSAQNSDRAKAEEKKVISQLAKIITFCLISGLLYFYLYPPTITKHATGAVVDDFLEQYKLVRASGNKTDTCMYAGIVAASMVQNHDAAGYARWKAQQATDCKAAGIKLPLD